MEQPTYDDVNLILRLYELRREEKMRQAREWFAKSCKPKTFEEFQQLCPPGSDQNAYYRMVMSYWDMVASFITSRVLNEELFFQSGGELMFCWARTMHLIPQMRKLFGPRVAQNMEEVANRYIRYMEERDPGWFERLTTMVRA
jgi:hypothetical protein